MATSSWIFIFSSVTHSIFLAEDPRNKKLNWSGPCVSYHWCCMKIRLSKSSWLRLCIDGQKSLRHDYALPCTWDSTSMCKPTWSFSCSTCSLYCLTSLLRSPNSANLKKATKFNDYSCLAQHITYTYSISQIFNGSLFIAQLKLWKVIRTHFWSLPGFTFTHLKSLGDTVGGVGLGFCGKWW